MSYCRHNDTFGCGIGFAGGLNLLLDSRCRDRGSDLVFVDEHFNMDDGTAQAGTHFNRSTGVVRLPSLKIAAA